MTIIRKLRNQFFGPQGSIYKKFSKGNFPDEVQFKSLFSSQGFIAELDDTAKENEQGFVELQTDDESKDRVVPVTGDFSKTVRAHQLPKLELVGGTETSDTDGTSITGWGLKITSIKKTVGSFFRRNFRIENTMTLESDETTTPSKKDLNITLTATGYKQALKLSSANASLTIAATADGEVLFTAVPGVGPKGDNVIELVKNSEGLVPCDSVGTPSSYPTVLVKLYDGTTHVDMSGFNLADPTVFDPVVTNCAATYAHSGMDVLITFTAATADVGNILIKIYYNGYWYTLDVAMIKVKAGTNANNWVYKGELTSAPAGPSAYWWYKNPNTEYVYWYDGAIWQVLLAPADQGPTAYTTLTNAGLSLVLTNTSKKEQIIHVPAGVVLAAPIDVTTSGTFPDGCKFNVIFDGGFTSTGQTVTVLGKVIDEGVCVTGNMKIGSVYSLTDTNWNVNVFGPMEKLTQPLIYKCYLDQSMTGDPYPSIIYNTIGAIIWTRTAIGHYRGTLTGAFTGSTFIIPGNCVAASLVNANINVSKTSNYVTIITQAGGIDADDVLFNTPLSIEVYP